MHSTTAGEMRHDKAQVKVARIRKPPAPYQGATCKINKKQAIYMPYIHSICACALIMRVKIVRAAYAFIHRAAG